MQERRLTGPAALRAVVELCQRSRAAHPTDGLFEAAEFEWWWRDDRPSDDLEQPVWFDADGRPCAAARITAWRSHTAVDVVAWPGTGDEMRADVFRRGLEVAATLDGPISFELAEDDTGLLRVATEAGFEIGDLALAECWIDASAVPPVSSLAEGYTVSTRAGGSAEDAETAEVNTRLRQTSLYRDDLDLVVRDASGEIAARGIFWFDPVSRTGLVEPMRTFPDHQRKGLARHVLTNGIRRLVAEGAERIKICVELDNTPAHTLYLDVGFVPHRRTVTVSRPPSDPA